jgi:hypothetical protein
MKKFIHPQKKNTLIKFQNGASYIKSWIYYRSFINDSSSISYSYITKLKQFKIFSKKNKQDRTQKISERNQENTGWIFIINKRFFH